ncbi:wax ester/triacylglycerol synthase domain-containing protein [Gryllotalpicola daejeonensis]|uniref:wax ester/triacylglycerol synthase domain-containing protein n=1 Tax=Gryllotalpicola daejeonensis TaxID=993087 RepID=UPI0031D1CB8A
MSPLTEVELMRTLDEKFIRTSIEFEAMWPTATIIVESGPFRGIDGAIDRERLEAVLMAVGERFVETRMRLMDAPLGLTAPMWVPAGPLDAGYHVGWFPRVPTAAEEPALFAGAGNVPRLRDRPLWRYCVVERADGDLAIIGSAQHALGDALFALKFVDALLGDGPGAPARLGAAPRSRLSGLMVVWGRWLRARTGPRDAWHEYWRKPFRKRLSRWGGRLLRPARNRAIDRRGLRALFAPQPAAAYWFTELAPAAQLAERLGGGVSDLVTALALRVVARLEDGPGEASVAIPVSRRRREAQAVRNSIVMLRVAVSRAAPLADVVAAVHAQVRAFGRSGEGDLSSAESGAYASYLPYRRSPAAIGGAAVRSVLLWPVPIPGSRFGLFASSYAGGLSFTALSAPGLDPAAIRAVVEDELADAWSALAAAEGVAP